MLEERGEKKQYNVRLATLRDAHAVAALHVRSWKEAYTTVLPPDYIERWSDVESRQIWYRRIEQTNDPAVRVWLIESGEELAGFARTGPSHDDDKSEKATAELYAIYVDPAYLRHGLGAKLLEWALDDLECSGYSECCTWVFELHGRARHFYECAGFVLDGQTQILEIDTFQVPVLRYKYSLSRPA